MNGGQCYTKGDGDPDPTIEIIEIYAQTGCDTGTTTYKIPNGQTRYIEFRADIRGPIMPTDFFGVRLEGDAAYPLSVGNMINMFSARIADSDSNDDFIWSPNSTNTLNS